MDLLTTVFEDASVELTDFSHAAFQGELKTLDPGTIPQVPPLLQRKGEFTVAKMRTDSGKTFNMRGLQQNAGSGKYEFAYEMEGVGANGAGKPAVPTGTGAKARSTIARLRGQRNGNG